MKNRIFGHSTAYIPHINVLANLCIFANAQINLYSIICGQTTGFRAFL
jgi:hypothetical protein